MTKKMINTTFVLLFAALLVGGCGSKKLVTTGFLSDYSRLEAKSGTSMRYIKPGALRNYSKFIVDPVAIHFHSRAKGKKTKSEDLRTLQKYMYDAVVKSLSSGYQVAYRPGPGVARLRIALTDVKKSSPVLNAIPQTKLVGLGLGSASMEAEMVDSQTGEQIGAVVESQVGKRLSLKGLSTWGDAKAVMDDWAKRLRKRIDEAHGRM